MFNKISRNIKFYFYMLFFYIYDTNFKLHIKHIICITRYYYYMFLCNLFSLIPLKLHIKTIEKIHNKLLASVLFNIDYKYTMKAITASDIIKLKKFSVISFNIKYYAYIILEKKNIEEIEKAFIAPLLVINSILTVQIYMLYKNYKEIKKIKHILDIHLDETISNMYKFGQDSKEIVNFYNLLIEYRKSLSEYNLRRNKTEEELEIEIILMTEKIFELSEKIKDYLVLIKNKKIIKG